MIRALAFLGGLLLGAQLVYAASTVGSVDRILIPVSQLERAAEFYTCALSFVPSETRALSGRILRLGNETIELVQRNGRAIPVDSRSNDRWFQHLAIVVSDIDQAYAAVLRAGAAPISAGPQLLPAWNSNADGIRAVYFRDRDGHPLELIQYPPGTGFVLSLFPEGHQVIALYAAATIIVFGFAVLGIYMTGSTASGSRFSASRRNRWTRTSAGSPSSS